MTNAELVKAVATVKGATQKETKEFMEALESVVIGEMEKESEVKLFSGVTLAGVHKDARIARNPLTGKDVQVEAKTAPKAKFTAGFKAKLNA